MQRRVCRLMHRRSGSERIWSRNSQTVRTGNQWCLSPDRYLMHLCGLHQTVSPSHGSKTATSSREAERWPCLQYIETLLSNKVAWQSSLATGYWTLLVRERLPVCGRRPSLVSCHPQLFKRWNAWHTPPESPRDSKVPSQGSWSGGQGSQLK